MSYVIDSAKRAKAASYVLAHATDKLRREALELAAKEILLQKKEILSANSHDIARAEQDNMAPSLLDRLMLNDERVNALASALEEIARQPDPLGRVLEGKTLDSGIRMEKVSVPLGVVAIIYEARPNVTADGFGLCIRSGNACLLKGGSAAAQSAQAIASACRAALKKAGLPEDALIYLDTQDHAQTIELMHARHFVDVLIPRGSARLIKTTVEESKVPVIETGTGNCHIYVHESADPDQALSILINAKTSRPGVCNAAESLLVDTAIADTFLPRALKALAEKNVVLVGDELSCTYAQAARLSMHKATPEDWGMEYLDLKISIKCVSGIHEAIEHINRYGSGHSEAIIAQDYVAAEKFLDSVDAAAVYVNASTRFTDGGVFGLGAEIGIATQKLHARGPMGAFALTTTKYLLRGNGQIR